MTLGPCVGMKLVRPHGPTNPEIYPPPELTIANPLSLHAVTGTAQQAKNFVNLWDMTT